ncbi:MAG: MFS transporter [Pseudomonadota bacterium]
MAELAASAAAHQKPGLMTRIAYGVGGAAGGIKNNGFDYVLLLFYSQVLGLSAFYVAAAIWIALIFDAVSDPVVGYWSDNLRTRLGRRHPFMYIALVPIALAYFFVWNPPADLGQLHLFFWLLAMTVATRIMYTLFEVPHHALAAELSQDYDERTSLMSFRYFFAWVGGLTVQIILFLFLLEPSEGDPSGYFHIDGWHTYGLLGATTIFFAIAITTFGTHRHIPHLKAPPPQRVLKPAQVFGEIFQIFTNPSFRALFIASLFGFLATGISATLNQYINGFFWELTSDQIGIITFSVYVSAILALVIAPVAGKALGKKKAAIVVGALAFTIAPAPVLARQFGLMPPNGTDALFYTVLFITLIDVALIIAYQMLAASMIADIVEQNELKTGRRSEGIFFAGITFIRKLSQGIGVLTASFILGIAAIVPGMRLAETSPESIRMLGWGYGLMLLLIWTLMLISISFYRISRADHEENLAELGRRNAT